METVNPFWNEPPRVELLQWLARGDLKQRLLQAVRLWVWLHFLYGEAGIKLNLPENFTYPEWRDAFFTATHTREEEIPALHDPKCRCAKTVAAWLFGSDFNLTQSKWKGELGKPEVQEKERSFEQSLREHHLLPDNLKELLHDTRLFGLTRRSLYGDLQVLIEIGWLKRQGNRYYRVKKYPRTPSSIQKSDSRLIAYNLDFLTQPDLAAIADNLSTRLNGQQRFFIHLEYVIPQDSIDRVEEWQAQLRELWQQEVVPPILLSYESAVWQTTLSVVVYPVCIYYYQRGPYLCAFGEVPQDESGKLDFRNYRLDRIQDSIPLSWDDPQVPVALKRRYQKKTLPIPDDIQLAIAEVWGFDYYQPPQLLLLRFDREWDNRYIRNTMRHATFARVAYQEVERLIRQNLKGEQQQKMLNIWRKCSPQDAYYQAQYRQGDPNVMQRLRAWRPNVEILLPVELREQAKREVEKEWKIYEE
ncbi:TIGR03985 family CRISPR-associated protein [Aerosakkonema sp. BLCC-F183]|uniref:TIGR03985 family CRISPR-associated protein n=1 Tax=Aerosakkonema sp. BLCC-F183 TaxID=3342834 RepID=UPI0035BA7B55